MNTIIYVNEKRVTKDEIKNLEIQNDNVKRILSDKLLKNNNSQKGLKWA